MKDLLVKMASVADSLDEAGYYKEADTITEIMKRAKKKIDTSYVDKAIGRMEDTFNSIANRLEGPTASRSLSEAGVSRRQLASYLVEMENTLGKIRSMVPKDS